MQLQQPRRVCLHLLSRAVGSFPVEADVVGHVQLCPWSPASCSVLCRGQQLSQTGTEAREKNLPVSQGVLL